MDMDTQHVAMFLLNHGQPFISGELAGKIVLLVLKEKYPAEIFDPYETYDLEDRGLTWLVTFRNKLVKPGEEYSSPDGQFRNAHISLEIRKKDGAILAME